MNVTFNDFMAFCKSINGHTLKTKRGNEFKLTVVENDLFFHLKSTGNTRTHDKPYIKKVLERFNETHSLITSDYQDITANSSYHTTLLRLYLNGQKPNEIPSPISLSDFIAFCRTQSGRVFETPTRKEKFTVTVIGNGLQFHLSETGKTRNHTEPYVEKVLQRFNETQSFVQKDYPMTVNQPYQLVLIEMYLRNRRKPS